MTITKRIKGGLAFAAWRIASAWGNANRTEAEIRAERTADLSAQNKAKLGIDAPVIVNSIDRVTGEVTTYGKSGPVF